MKKYKNELCFLSTCSKSQRGKFIKKAPTDIIKAIADISNTVLYGSLPISPNLRVQLRKNLKILNELAVKRNSFAKKRKIITSQKGGNILGVIWNVIKNLF